MMTNRTYDRLKWLVQIGLPAAAVLCQSLAEILAYPQLNQLGQVLVCVTVFLGTTLQISSKVYQESLERSSLHD